MESTYRVVALAAAIVAAASLQAQVTFARILRADREPHDWLSYWVRYSISATASSQITTANAKNLELQSIGRARSLEKFEATALVVDGVRRRSRRRNRPSILDDDVFAGAGSAEPVAGASTAGSPSSRHLVHGHDRHAPARARRQER